MPEAGEQVSHCPYGKFTQSSNVFRCSIAEKGPRPDIGMCQSCQYFMKLPKKRTLLNTVAKAAGRAAKAIVTGKKIRVSSDEQRRRIDICKQCLPPTGFYNARQDRCTKCGCKGNYKTRLATESCPIGKWGIVKEGPKRVALAVINPTIVKRIGGSLIEACDRHNIDLKIENLKQYNDKLRGSKNVITYGVKMPMHWYQGHKDANYLYVENALFSQSAGTWMDDRGWFAHSTIVNSKEYLRPITADNESWMYRIIKQWGWEFFAGSNPDGPIMVALQNNRDAPVLYHYLHKMSPLTPMQSMIKIVSAYYKDREVVIRPHPRFRGGWLQDVELAKSFFGPKWRVEEDGNVYTKLKDCSKLITVNSTLATEAISLGIPVATLGAGAFTGSNATFECAKDHTRLAGFDSFVPDPQIVKRYIGAVLKHQVKIGATVDEILANESFIRWVERCK